MNPKHLAKSKWIVDPKLCNGCGDCVVICPVRALAVKGKKASMVDEPSCCHESCRICEYTCPKAAITAW